MSDTIGQGWDSQDWAQDKEPKPPPRLRRRGRWWRWPVTALILLVEGIIFIVAIGGVGLAWRAAQGPVDLSVFLPKIGRAIAVAAPRLDVSIGHFAIAWRGFTEGPDQPVQLTAAAIRVDDKAAGRSLSVDRLSVDLSAAWAVRGVVAPRTVTLLGPRVTLRRGSPPQPAAERPAAGRRMTPHDIVAVLAQPPATDKHLVKERAAALSELVRVTITGGQLLLEPPPGASGARTLRAGDIAAVITRGAAGGLTGEIRRFSPRWRRAKPRNPSRPTWLRRRRCRAASPSARQGPSISRRRRRWTIRRVSSRRWHRRTARPFRPCRSRQRRMWSPRPICQ